MFFRTTGIKRKYSDTLDYGATDYWPRTQIKQLNSHTCNDEDSRHHDTNLSGDESRQLSSAASAMNSRNSPLPNECASLIIRKFTQNASVVLIGMSGTGKSSLAVILSKATGRQLIDSERFFQQVTGKSRSSFKAVYGTPAYKREERDVMMELLKSYSTNCVITCAGSMERDIQSLLGEFAKTHAVIHILRDARSIHDHIKSWSLERVEKLLTVSGLLFRSCSNLEFFNVSETGTEASEILPESTIQTIACHRAAAGDLMSPFLTLKRVERDFLQFVAFATGDTAELTKVHSSFPLSSVPIEARQYTYAVSISLCSFLESELDIEAIGSTADAFELRIDVMDEPTTHLGLSPQIVHSISEAVGVIRRNIIVPIIYHVTGARSPDLSSGKTCRRSDYEYLNLIEHGLRLAPDFLTIDLSFSDSTLSRIVASRGYTRIIGQFSPLEDNLQIGRAHV